MRARPLLLLAGCVLVALAAVSALAGRLPAGSAVPPVLYGVVVAATGPATLWLRRREERRSLAAAPDSLERHAAERAAALAFVDLVVMALLSGGALLLGGQTVAGLAVAGVVVAGVAAFWIRYLVMLRVPRAEP